LYIYKDTPKPPLATPKCCTNATPRPVLWYFGDTLVSLGDFCDHKYHIGNDTP